MCAKKSASRWTILGRPSRPRKFSPGFATGSRLTRRSMAFEVFLSEKATDDLFVGAGNVEIVRIL
jgi:hypothetical protein